MSYRIFVTLLLFLIRPKHRHFVLTKLKFLGSIGESGYINIYNFGTEPKNISLGNNVFIATGVRLITHDMTPVMIGRMYKKNGIVKKGDITIGNNVSIGADVIIMPNITIGSNVIIAAGAVVTKSVSDGQIVGGCPAKKIGDFDSYLASMDM